MDGKVDRRKLLTHSALTAAAVAGAVLAEAAAASSAAADEQPLRKKPARHRRKKSSGMNPLASQYVPVSEVDPTQPVSAHSPSLTGVVITCNPPPNTGGNYTDAYILNLDTAIPVSTLVKKGHRPLGPKKRGVFSANSDTITIDIPIPPGSIHSGDHLIVAAIGKSSMGSGLVVVTSDIVTVT